MPGITRRTCLAGALWSVPAVVSASIRDLDAIDSAGPPQLGRRSAPGPGPRADIVKLQVLLDRRHCSPGVIDGLDGSNLRKAVRAAREMAGLDEGADATGELWQWLSEADGPILQEVRITSDDHKGPFAPDLPEDYGELAQRRDIPFRGIEEMLAERYHMDEDLLTALNPGPDAFAEGRTIRVAAPGEARRREGRLGRVEVRVREGVVRALGRDDTLVAAYPASVGSPRTPSPSGTHRVNGVARNPDYTYDPELNFRQGNNRERLRLPPGPNNPVGTVWIDLSRPTYGLHGTPEPSKIDKTGSHGCVRLTNWDAEELAGLVHVGLEVAFLR